jgi:hypothetical protein
VLCGTAYSELSNLATRLHLVDAADESRGRIRQIENVPAGFTVVEAARIRVPEPKPSRASRRTGGLPVYACLRTEHVQIRGPAAEYGDGWTERVP